MGSWRRVGRVTVRPRLMAVLVVVATLCVGCGGEEGGPPSAEPTPSATMSVPVESPTSQPSGGTSSSTPAATPGLPDCAKIWVAGQRLPRRYQGCVDAGSTVPDRGTMCVVGHELVVFRNRYYAVATGKISEAADVRSDPGYAQTKDLCKHGTPSG